MVNINLLPGKNFLTPHERQRRHYLFLALGLTSPLFLILFGGLFAYRAYLTTQINLRESQKAALLSELEGQKSLALNLRTVKEKVRGIKIVRFSQTDLSSRITLAQSLLPGGAKLNSLGLGEDNTLTASLLLPSIADLESLVDRLTSQSGPETLENIHLSSLNYTTTGTSVNLSAKLIPSKNP